MLCICNLYAFENNIISCKTCKWFIKNNNGIDNDNLCGAFSKTTFRENEKILTYEYANNCRNKENLCGKIGKLYKEKLNKEKLNKEKMNNLQHRSLLLYEYYRFISNNDDKDVDNINDKLCI